MKMEEVEGILNEVISKNGNKKTELGLIPEEWSIFKIADVCKLINGRGFKPFEWSKNGLPIIRIQNLNGSDDFNYFNGRYDKKIEVNRGQLLFAWSGSRGTSFGPHIWIGPKGLLNYHTWKVEINESEINRDYFLYALKNLTKFIEDKAHGAAALVHVQKWEMETFNFIAPEQLHEQTAIATALSDADALIRSLEQLIEKKKKIKQGAMQELLRPKEGWVRRKLGEIADIFGGGTPSTMIDKFWNGSINWFTPTEIGDHKYIIESNRKITKEGFLNSSAKLLPVGSILLTTRAGIGDLGILIYEGCTNQGFQSFVVKEENSNEFLYYMLQTMKSVFIQNASGSTFLEISPKKLKAIEIDIPDFETQVKISQTLSDIDIEISNNQKKLKKIYEIKQGMMQNLLTGKIRLI